MSRREVEALQKEKKRYEKCGKLDEVATTCSALGLEYTKLGLYDDAIDQHQEELLLCESLCDKLGVAVANRHLGECHAVKGEFQKALDYTKKYLEIAQSIDSNIEEQRAYATLGRTYYMQLDDVRNDKEIRECCDKAETAYKSSLDLCNQLKNEIKEQEYYEMKARLLLNLGLIYDVKNDIEQCALHLREAINIAEKYKLTEDRYRCNLTLGGIYQRNNNYGKALDFMEKAVKCAQLTKNKSHQIEVYCQKGVLHLQNDDVTKCRKSFKKAFKLKSSIKEEKEKVVSLLKAAIRLDVYCFKLSDASLTTEKEMKLSEKAGDACATIGAYDQALKYYKQMLHCGLRLELSPKDFIPTYVSLAQTYQDLKNYKKAAEMFEKEIQCRGKDYLQISRSYLNIVDCYDKMSVEYEKLMTVYNKALTSAKKAKNIRLQKQILRDMLETQKYYNHEEDIYKTEEKLAKFRGGESDGSSHDDDDEDTNSQNTLAGDETDVDLNDLSDSDGEQDEEFAGPRIGVARHTGYKIKRNEKGETELHTACINGHFRRVQSLLDKGHPVNERDSAGWLPIHEACNFGWSTIVELLISKGARINDRGGDHCEGITPLMDVCCVALDKSDVKKVSEKATYVNRHLDIIHMLVKAGANVHTKNKLGSTAYDCLREQKLDHHDELSYEEVAYLNKTLKFLKAVMQGNNPHLVAESSSLLDENEDSDEQEELPSMSRRRRNQDHSNTEVNSGSDSDDTIDGENVPPAVVSSEDIALLNEHPEHAPMAYRNTMKEIGRSAIHNVALPKARSQANIKTPALVSSSQYAGEEWLEDDIGINNPKKRKRRDLTGNVLFTSGMRKRSRTFSEEEPSKDKRKTPKDKKKAKTTEVNRNDEDVDNSFIHLNNDDDENNQEVINSRSEQDSPVTVIHQTQYSNHSPTPQIRTNDEDEDIFASLQTASPGINRSSQHSHHKAFTSRSVDQVFEEINECSDNILANINQFSSPAAVNHQTNSFSNHHRRKSQQLKITNFGDKLSKLSKKDQFAARQLVDYNQLDMVTVQSASDSHSSTSSVPQPKGLLMRLRVRIKERQILVPVPIRSEPITMAWVASEAADRYYEICNVKPILSLSTKDGALFSPNDLVIDLCGNNDELVGIIESYNLPHISSRYTDACKALKVVCYTNIKGLLHACDTSNKLELQNLALRPNLFQPIARSLQHQCSLTELCLKGNKIGDTGVKDLAAVLPTLLSLCKLDVSCNSISSNGIKSLAECFEKSEANGDKPLQALEKLDLSYNNLGDSCTLHIAKLISNLPALVTIHLAACDFTMRFFQSHRISLAQAIKGSNIEELNFSRNAVSSTGVELLLMCLRVDALRVLNLSHSVSVPMSNGITKSIETYLNQPSVALNELILDACHLLPENILDLVRCMEVNSTLSALSISHNKKLCTSDIHQLLHASSINSHSRLQSFTCLGCNLTSPLSTELLDALTEKLHHNFPLRRLHLGVIGGWSKNDAEVLIHEVWCGKWGADMSEWKLLDNTVLLQVKEEI